MLITIVASRTQVKPNQYERDTVHFEEDLYRVTSESELACASRSTKALTLMIRDTAGFKPGNKPNVDPAGVACFCKLPI